ncbi:MAG: aldehyde ferredoxin oxidoreductase family protein [Candidatus Hadarchaeales archaeon]
MKGGYKGKILRVNLSTGRIEKENLSPELARKFLGGVGLGSYLLFKEVPAGTDPLGESNKLFFCTGPLTGTRIPTGRYVVVFKSPLTSILGWSSSAGHWGPELKFAGYDLLIVEGASSSPVYLWIDDDFVELRKAQHLWGATTSETQRRIRKELGDEEVRIACIGPAGERLVRFASIINDEGRAAGRCGAGAVMGSKKLKAIAVRGHGGVKVADPERVSELVKRMYEVWKSEPFVRSLHLYGTNAMTSFTSGIAAFPTRNFQSGWFEEWEKLSGPTLSKTLLVKKAGCFGCPIACGRVSVVKSGPYQGMVVWGPEYEHVNTFGAGCGNSDLEIVSICHQLVNEYGMDGISCGRAISFAMECYEKGLLKKEEADGLDLTWGNKETIVELVKRIGERRGIGDLLAEGTRLAAKRLGRGTEKYAMQTKGLEYAGYEPRGMKGMALTYALGNRGGCHITTGMLYLDIGTMTWMYPLDSPLDPQVLDLEKVKAEIALERRYTVIEAAVLCKFFAGIVFTPSLLASSLSAVTGWEMDEGEVDRIGERIWTLQRMFNVREGISRKDDTLPERFFTEPLPDGFSQGQVLDRKTFEEMLDTYYRMVGWDENGIPREEKIRELGLEEFLPLR